MTDTAQGGQTASGRWWPFSIQSPHRDQVRTTILEGTGRPGRGTVQKLWIQGDSGGETDRVGDGTSESGKG